VVTGKTILGSTNPAGIPGFVNEMETAEAGPMCLNGDNAQAAALAGHIRRELAAAGIAVGRAARSAPALRPGGTRAQG